MPATDPRALVLACIDAINEERFDALRPLLRDDFTFVGALGSRNGADAYVDDMRKMKLKYSVHKSFADASDVCVFYDLKLGGADVFCAAWYRVDGDRIASLRVVFDPRPVLAQQPAR